MGSDSEEGNVKIGRNAGTGRFTKVEATTARPRTHVVEAIRKKR